MAYNNVTANRQDFANSLTLLADQLRVMEQRIITSTDNHINHSYKTQKREIKHCASAIKKITNQSNACFPAQEMIN